MTLLMVYLAVLIVVVAVVRMLLGGPEVEPLLMALFLLLAAIYDEIKQ